MRNLIHFILTTIPQYCVKLVRWFEAIIKKIPLGAFALVVVGRFFASLLNGIGFLVNSYMAYDIGGTPELRRYWKSNAVMNDKKLNVTLQYTLNAVMITGEVEQHLKYGQEFSTISDQMGRIPKVNDTRFSIWCEDVLLDTIEKEHCAKAVQLNNNALLKRVKELKLINT
jgi:hypothetical protein